MKKLLFVVCAFAAISLLAPSAGFAQWENRIGMYTSADAADANLDAGFPLFTPITIYFVVSNPLYPDNSGPMPSIDAFEFKVTAVPASNWFKLSETKPTGAVDVGAQDSVAGTYEYIAGWAAPLPVVNGMVKIMEWSVLFQGAGPYYFYLGPSTLPSVPGKMAVNFTDVDGTYLTGCMPSSGAFAAAVFAAGDIVNPVESASFGSVKSLFR